jgi:hypothetical protein
MKKELFCLDMTSVDYRVHEVSDEENHSITPTKFRRMFNIPKTRAIN